MGTNFKLFFFYLLGFAGLGCTRTHYHPYSGLRFRVPTRHSRHSRVESRPPLKFHDQIVPVPLETKKKSLATLPKGRHGSGFSPHGLGWVKVSKCLHGSTQPMGHINGSVKFVCAVKDSTIAAQMSQEQPSSIIPCIFVISTPVFCNF